MSFRASMLGKNGDLCYALPVIKALARKHGKVRLLTSALCYQLVPLLWEQPYIEDVEMYPGRVKMDNGAIEPWALFSPEEGVNLSPQPSMYRPRAPVPWTLAYAEIAGIDESELTVRDYIAFPTLWNHRQWYWEHEVNVEGKLPWKPPRTIVLAPESETLKTISLDYWHRVARELAHEATVLVVGCKPDREFARIENLRDLRGLTTVSSMARLLAEAHLVISANSLPWHLARHAGTPSFCYQDQYLERCAPIDTPTRFYRAENTEKMIEDALSILRDAPTTLWSGRWLAELQGISQESAA